METARAHSDAEAKMLRFFHYKHLPERLQPTSKLIHDLATTIVNESAGPSAELTAGLRKLLEAKDCFVRARLESDEIHP
jgi:hypothetical protein